MQVILCHQTVDFDALGAAVGLACLRVGARVVLTGGAHPGVKRFLALYRGEFPLLEMRSVHPEQLRTIMVVDNQQRQRLGKATNWFEEPQVKQIEIYDHHMDQERDIPATYVEIENVGSTTTLITEKLQARGIELDPYTATVMALGIHVDTGSLTFDQTTVRDAQALTWLMGQGAVVKIIADYVEPSFSPQVQSLFAEAMGSLERETVRGYQVAQVLLRSPTFVPGLSSMAERMMQMTDLDGLLVGHFYHQTESEGKLVIIGRSRIIGTNLNQLFEPYGGGGHDQASALSMRVDTPESTLKTIYEKFTQQIPQAITARDLMTAPVRTILPATSIGEAQRVLFRYGHSGLVVVDDAEKLVGVISRRDLDLALHHGFQHAPVKGYMSRKVRTISPATTLRDIEKLMVNFDVGRLPVVDGDRLVGIVTRTDILRQHHQEQRGDLLLNSQEKTAQPLTAMLAEKLDASLWDLLQSVAIAAQKRGWHLYLVGGGVRDLLLAEKASELLLQDIDLVVDGFHAAADVGAGVELASFIKELYPEAKVAVHGEFQTAAIVWHQDPILGALCMDIATARTEFYPYPAANPEVEASSIRQDLYRRDFTINALCLRLTEPRAGDLLDFFGGLIDLKKHQIRVLHANSFIEDPTRIYRAVRFAVRLNFALESQTEEYIQYAIASGIYERLHHEKPQAPALTTRLRAELKYLLTANYWKPALQLLDSLGALQCIHKNLALTADVWWQVRCVDRWLRHQDSDKTLEHWRMRLESLLINLPTSARLEVGDRLQLPKDSLQRLAEFTQHQENILPKLAVTTNLSGKVFALKGLQLPDIILLAAIAPKKIRHDLWCYLRQWQFMKAPLDGSDLKELGYKPSPQFRIILQDLLQKTLDGEIGDRSSALSYLEQHYPLEPSS
ncbi:Polynucleotide adenylyltransferase region [[Leptolyngbya] sp. PCC 7376]|uniref:CBS domain-containing protein n=1 Tax=[Leptolyngbya] sp. PCC 7376 TaxID=111781 RepID=UPI00029ED7FB|nr:CBS domain-containing protein [[Leptolyngbya] sp. PCC 7376]AFY36626.1 Polynucleotide adenylyltransferase region [[Leptolyngbya] sp. PCC 7376]